MPAFTLRDAHREDAPVLARLFREPDVVDNTLRSPETTEADVLAFLAPEPGPRVRHVCAVAEDRAVGFLALMQGGFPPDAHVAEFFVLTDPAWRRRGVARALVQEAVRTALEEWGLTRVELEVLADNAGASRLYESLGFRREGVKRRAFRRRSGELVDCVVMGLLRDEWTADARAPGERASL